MSTRADNPCLWWQDRRLTPRSRLRGDARVDIAIIGGGFTGLWTALFIKQLAPDCRVAIVEAQHCGFGASGRNGGWLIGSLEGLSAFADTQGALSQAVIECLRTLVPSVTTTLDALGIDCGLAHGGALSIAARFPEQQQRATAYLKSQHELGFSTEDYDWLGADALHSRVRVRQGYGAVYTPHVAVLQPMQLLQALADKVADLGVDIFEASPVHSISAQRINTPHGHIDAEHIVIATEGYSEKALGLRRALLPIHSGMVATEVLSDQQWQALGFFQREAVSDFSRVSTYLQRTADNRLVVGARGSYSLARRRSSGLMPSPRDDARRRRLARELVGELGPVRISHSWGGALAVSRRFTPHVIIDRQRCLATAGGYAGEGVGASFLFGRTLAELLLKRDSPRTQMPWVHEQRLDQYLRVWEPEPLPWLGFNSAMMLFDLEDRWLSARTPAWSRSLIGACCSWLERTLIGH